MELQVLLSRLENAGYHPQISGNRDSNCDMIHIRILTEGQRHFEETTLYLTVVYFGAGIRQAELFNMTLENLTELQQITAGMHILANALFSGNGASVSG